MSTASPRPVERPGVERPRVGQPDAERPRIDRAALVLGVAVLAIAATIGWDAWRLTGRAVRYGLSPYVVPFVVAATLAVLGVGLVVSAVRGAFPEREEDEFGPVLWIVVGVVLQIALLRTAGFSIATGFLFAFTARAMGRGPLWLTVPIGIAVSLVLWIIFTQLLSLSLPAGPLERLYLSGQHSILS